ncbi:MAG TPA: hypothetical protein VKU85_21295 [bacterium]|nr:hypothetical protein [bacterium]
MVPVSALALFAPLDPSAIPPELRAWWIGALAFAAGTVVTILVLRRGLGAREYGVDVTPVVPSLRARMPALHSEVDRARRYERSLSVVVIQLDDATTLGASLGLVDPESGAGIANEQARAMIQAARHVMFWNVGYVLNDLLRENDVAACDLPERRYVILLPEAEEQEARQTAQRLEKRILEGAGVHVRPGVAVYREHGLTIEHLLESAAAMSDRMAKGTMRPFRERRASKIHRIPDRRTSS